MRTLTLRIFVALLLLPFVAFPVLAALHELLFPGTWFDDTPVVLVLFVLVLLAADRLLNAIGRRRYRDLDTAGWQSLTLEDDQASARIFADMEKLFRGGLLTSGTAGRLREEMLRRYFPFFLERIGQSEYRASLRHCLRNDIRAGEAFSALKGYLLSQKLLSAETIDLAEELQEHAPGDRDIVSYMVEQYLADRQRHYRASYFYRLALESGPIATDGILNLCLQKAVTEGRTDAFAGWLYVRALERPDVQESGGVAHLAWRTCRMLKYRKDLSPLLGALDASLASTPPEQIADWERAFAESEKRQFVNRLGRARYRAMQWGHAATDLFMRYRGRLVGVFGSAALIALLYFAWPEQQAAQEEPLPEPVPQAEETARFSLQVAALKSRTGARREADRLKTAGLDAYVAPAGGRSSYHRIRIGKYATKVEAQSQGDSLRQKKLIDDFFVVNFSGPAAAEQ